MFLFPIGLVLGFAIYSWYWQATITMYSKYRMSSVIWALILMMFAFSSQMLEVSDPIINVFIASFLLMSIVDGFGGLAPKHVVVSGRFIRAVKYADLAKITLIPVPSLKKPSVMAVFTTLKNQSFYMKFNKKLEEIIPILNTQTENAVQIEVQNIQQ